MSAEILLGRRFRDLGVLIIAAEGKSMLGGMPEPEPFPEGEPLPDYRLPELTFSAFGAGFCAVDAQGQIVFTWFNIEVPAGEPLPLAWDVADGPVPTVKAVEVGNRPVIWVSGIWSAVTTERPAAAIARAGLHSYWMVAGSLPYLQLCRVAASLPQM